MRHLSDSEFCRRLRHLHETSALLGCHSQSQSAWVQLTHLRSAEQNESEGGRRACVCVPFVPYLHLRDPVASGETRDAPKHFALAKAPTTPSACTFGTEETLPASIGAEGSN